MSKIHQGNKEFWAELIAYFCNAQNSSPTILKLLILHSWIVKPIELTGFNKQTVEFCKLSMRNGAHNFS
jgi:hypothetical protein